MSLEDCSNSLSSEADMDTEKWMTRSQAVLEAFGEKLCWVACWAASFASGAGRRH